MAVHLPPFDSSRDFVAQATFRFFGKPYHRGSPFPKDGVNERKLRQLYEQRRITYVDTPRGAQLMSSPLSTTPTVPDGVPRRRKPKLNGGTDGGEKALIKRLVGGHNKAELIKKASGLAGVTSDMTKAQIATALVRHGRGAA